MKTVYKMHYLKTHLSQLVEEINDDKQIVFGTRGQAQYVISKYRPQTTAKRPGHGLLKAQATGSVEPDLGGWTKAELGEFERGNHGLFG